MDILKKKAGWIVIKDGKFLVVYRKQLQDFTLPKGHIDEWENSEQCAIREVEEETWYYCSIKNYIWDMKYQYVDSNGDTIISIVGFYQMNVISYDITLIHEDEIESVVRFDLNGEWIMKLTNKSDQEFIKEHQQNLLN